MVMHEIIRKEFSLDSLVHVNKMLEWKKERAQGCWWFECCFLRGYNAELNDLGW